MSVFFLPDFHVVHVGYNALNKSRDDLFRIYTELGFSPLLDEIVTLDNRKVKYFGKNTEILGDYVNKVLDALTNKCKPGDFLFMDFPFAIKFIGFGKIVSYAKVLGVKVIFFIHDLDGIRFQLPFVNMTDSQSLDLCYCMISASKEMDECLLKQLKVSPTIKKVNYRYWDYLCRDVLNKKEEARVCFAGNLAKSTFLAKVPESLLSGGFNLYGKGMAKNYKGKFRGEYTPEELVGILDGKWGLVWDGKSPKTCTGNYGKYLRINASHKFGLYMATDKPVIVWKKSPISTFVEENGLGIAVNSLQEAGKKLDLIDEDIYRQMKSNILSIRKEVISGDHLKRVIKESML